MGWMVRLGESHVGRRLILVFAPAAGRRREIVHEQAGGPGHRRVCLQCGATVDEGEPQCPVDGGRVVDVSVRVRTAATSTVPTDWTPDRPDDEAAAGEDAGAP